MAVMDYAGATAARVLGIVALIPAWIALQRYTLPHFTGGPLVISVDTLRATLYPLLWIILAWVLLNPLTTRHFLYRREAWIARAAMGVIYVLAIPFVFLSAIGLVRTYWLQNPWIGDVLMVAMPVTWLAFLAAFSLPGTYAQNISDERDAAVEDGHVLADENRERELDRAHGDELSRLGVGAQAFEGSDTREEAWRQKVLVRQEQQDEQRRERRAAHDSSARNSIAGRFGIAAAIAAFIIAGLGIASQSPEISRFLDRYLPIILGSTAVIAFIVGSIVLGARRRGPVGNAMRMVGVGCIAVLLLKYVLLPAADRGAAAVYADYLEEAVASIQSALEFLGN